MTYLFELSMLAQEATGGGGAGGAGNGGGATSPGGGNSLMIALYLGVLAFFLIWVLGGRKDKRRRQDMLNAIKKNDRVMTIGGIIGTVVTTSDTEITLKVDESANVKITVVRSAIQKVLTEGETPTEVGGRQ